MFSGGFQLSVVAGMFSSTLTDRFRTGSGCKATSMEWHNLRTSYNLDLQLLKIHDSAIFDPIIISESRQKLLLSYYDPLAARYVEAVS